jgi:hypothetical protein
MSRNIIAIAIQVRENASKVFSSIVSSASGMAARLSSAWSSTSKTFGTFIRTLDSGVNLAEKAFRGASRAASFFIEQSVARRFSFDPQLVEINKFVNAVQDSAGRIGDMFYPAIVGLTEAVGPMIESFDEWLKINDTIIKHDIVDWLANLSSVLVNVVSASAVTATKVFFGFAYSFSAVKAAMAGLLEGALSVVPGADGLKASLSSMGIEAADEMERLKDETNDAVSAVDALQIKLTDLIAKARSEGHKAVLLPVFRSSRKTSDLEAKAKKEEEERKARELALADSISRLKIDTLKKQADLHLEYLKAEQEDVERAQKAGDERMLSQAKTSLRGLEEAWRDFGARRRESAEVNGDELTEMEKDRFIALHDITKEYTETVAGVLESGFGAFVSALKQTGSVLDALKDMFRSFVDYLIVQLLRILALKAAEAIINFFVPGAGTAIAGAAGTALNVAQHSSGGYVQRAAYGLGVTGGTPGVDSVPILAMAGERVLSRAETRAYEASHARGDVSPSPAAATNQTIVNQSIVALTSSRAQLRRLQRDVLEPERRRLERSKAIRV